MGFRVEPFDLDGYAGQVTRAAGYVAECVRFLDQHSEFESGGAMIQPLVDVHGPFVEQVRANLTRFREILDADATELRGSAEHYRRTDLDEAERLDGTHLTGG